MIKITDVANKLEELLNSFDSSDLLFVVKSQGYHLDSVADKKKLRNTIPVFLELVNGEYNPVPNLHQINFTYEVTIYFPVRFKEFFYNLNINLEDWFVGKKVQFGDEIALCNINTSEYGEIIGLQADEFENWVEKVFEGNVMVFKDEEEVTEPYMSMRFRLYATTLGEGFLFGNDVRYELQADFQDTSVNKLYIYYQYLRECERYVSGDETVNQVTYYAWKGITSQIFYTDLQPNSDNFIKYIKHQFKLYWKLNNVIVETGSSAEIRDMDYTTAGGYSTRKTNLIFANSGTGASISPVSQQLIQVDTYAKNIENIKNCNKSIVIYPQDNAFWDYFIFVYSSQKFNKMTNLNLKKIYSNGMVFILKQILLNINENIQLGDPLSFTLTYGDSK